MSVQKPCISFTDAALAFDPELVEAGEYPNICAADSGEMGGAKAVRARERTLLEVEVQRRLALPVAQWGEHRTETRAEGKALTTVSFAALRPPP